MAYVSECLGFVMILAIAVTGHQQANLEELGVDAALISDVMEVAGGTRDVVLIC